MNECMKEFYKATKDLQSSSNNTNNILLNMLQSFRLRRCRDPRDKVFASVGVLQRFAEVADEEIAMPREDYEKPVEAIYLDTARLILEYTRDLSHVLPESLDMTSNQPSWVPDWSLSRLWNPLAALGSILSNPNGRYIQPSPTR